MYEYYLLHYLIITYCLALHFRMYYRWQYSDESKTQGVFYKGEIASYGAGGFYFDFPTKKIDAKTTIKDLEHDTWLNRGTRAVFVDFAIYNCNLNVICAVKYGPIIFKFFFLSVHYICCIYAHITEQNMRIGTIHQLYSTCGSRLFKHPPLHRHLNYFAEHIKII